MLLSVHFHAMQLSTLLTLVLLAAPYTAAGKQAPLDAA